MNYKKPDSLSRGIELHEKFFSQMRQIGMTETLQQVALEFLYFGNLFGSSEVHPDFDYALEDNWDYIGPERQLAGKKREPDFRVWSSGFSGDLSWVEVKNVEQ